MEFKGSKTERNVLAAFAGESQARNDTVSSQALHEKKVLNKYLRFSRKHQIMRKNMQNCFSST